MLKKFIHGLVFGAGFAVAFILVSGVVLCYLLPHWAGYSVTQASSPASASVVEVAAASSPATQDYSFFNQSAHPSMQLPHGGGILSMMPVSTAAGSKKPNTYQLWLTENKLWEIRTREEQVDIRALPYPAQADSAELNKIMQKIQDNPLSGPSSMTIDSDSIAQLKSGKRLPQDKILNGQLHISAEGAVFVIPNPY